MSSPAPLQILSHYPALPPPVDVELWVSPPHECSYFSDRLSTTRAIHVSRIPPLIYHAFMDAGFRRSGRFIYQPACAGCRECVPLRVPVEQFVPSKSQRRCARRNADLVVSIHKPQPSGEKYALYARYLDQWHGKNDSNYDEFVSFLYDSPADTLEFEYREPRGNRLLAVGICDICPTSLSSVYFYFDPAESRRSLGTFGALREIAFAREGRTPYYYLGYWIRGCGSMSYKADFRPHEILCTDGVWRAANSSPAEVDAS